MTKIYKLICLLLVLALASGKTSFFPPTSTIDVGTLRCLRDAGDLEFAFTWLRYDSENHSWTTPVTTPEKIISVGTKPDIVFDLQTFNWKSFSAEVYSSEIARQFTGMDIRIIWLSPYFLTDTNRPTCGNILDFARAIKAKTGKVVGIISQNDIWARTFGSSAACPELSNLPLVNFDYGNKNPVAFGGWSRWEFQYLQLYNACSNNVVELKQN